MPAEDPASPGDSATAPADDDLGPASWGDGGGADDDEEQQGGDGSPGPSPSAIGDDEADRARQGRQGSAECRSTMGEVETRDHAESESAASPPEKRARFRMPAEPRFNLIRHSSDPVPPLLLQSPWAGTKWWAGPLVTSVQNYIDERARVGLSRPLLLGSYCAGFWAEGWAARALGIPIKGAVLAEKRRLSRQAITHFHTDQFASHVFPDIQLPTASPAAAPAQRPTPRGAPCPQI